MKLSVNHATHGLQGVFRSHQTGQEIHFNFPPGCTRLPILFSIGGHQIEGDLFISRREERGGELDLSVGLRFLDDKIQPERLAMTINEPPPPPAPIATEDEKKAQANAEAVRKSASDLEAKDPGFEASVKVEEDRSAAMASLDYKIPKSEEEKGGMILEDAPEMEKDMLLSSEERASGTIQAEEDAPKGPETSPFKPPETVLGGFQASPVPVPVSTGGRKTGRR